MSIYEDSLLRASLVVELDRRLWMVPKAENGWHHRLPLTLSPEAKAERLRPARGITAGWLGIREAEATV